MKGFTALATMLFLLLQPMAAFAIDIEFTVTARYSWLVNGYKYAAIEDVEVSGSNKNFNYIVLCQAGKACANWYDTTPNWANLTLEVGKRYRATGSDKGWFSGVTMTEVVDSPEPPIKAVNGTVTDIQSFNNLHYLFLEGPLSLQNPYVVIATSDNNALGVNQTAVMGCEANFGLPVRIGDKISAVGHMVSVELYSDSLICVDEVLRGNN